MKKPRFQHKHEFLKSTIISFGFLSGVWIHLGFDPQSFVFSLLQDILLKVEPEYVQAITIVFFALPIILTCIGVLTAYRRAGWWGLLATALAFYAGIILNVSSIGLLAAALIIGFFAARR
jgi:ABC-type sulfate transport system permease component